MTRPDAPALVARARPTSQSPRLHPPAHAAPTANATCISSRPPPPRGAQLIMAIEEAFDIEIPDEEAESMTTPADCVKAIKAKMS